MIEEKLPVVAVTLATDTIENRIKCARVRACLSGEALAAKMSINKDYYWKIEQKADRIGLDHLLEIAKATNVSVSWLVHGDEAYERVRLSAPTLGLRIREFRLLNGLGIRAFAQRIGMEKRSSSLSQWERGGYIPELRSLMRICDAFHVNIETFL